MRGVTPAAASRVGAPPPLMEGMTARAPLKVYGHRPRVDPHPVTHPGAEEEIRDVC